MCNVAIVDLAKKVKHTKMGEMIEEAVTNPSLVGVKLKQDLLDIAFPATVQSGGVYDLRATAQNDERPLKYDVITMSIGVLPASVCRHLRSLLVYCLNDNIPLKCIVLRTISSVCR